MRVKEEGEEGRKRGRVLIRWHGTVVWVVDLGYPLSFRIKHQRWSCCCCCLFSNALLRAHLFTLLSFVVYASLVERKIREIEEVYITTTYWR